MEKITTKSGEVIQFDLSKISKEHMRKVNLNFDGIANGEGIWTAMSEEDDKKYSDDSSTGKFVCVLMNHAINFMPNKSWGLCVVAEFRKAHRPVANLSLVDYSKKENRIWWPEVLEDERPEEFKYSEKDYRFH